MIRAYLGLVRKEFLQVLRDRNMLRIIFAVPIIQLLLLGYTVTTDVKYIALDVYDFNQSRYSRELVVAAGAGDYFTISDDLQPMLSHPVYDLHTRFQRGDAEMALLIPEDFSQKISARESVTVGLVVDGSNASSAATALGYMNQIVREYSADVTGVRIPVEIRPTVLYNPEAESVYFMVPGIVATLLTMITIMLTSMAIVREKEMGTLEQLLVTPISGTVLLFGKLSAFAVLGIIEISFALVVGVLWFGIPFVGSPVLLFALASLYMVATLGIGLLFSTVTSTQQQAMFFAWFFSIFAILTSGFFTPISNMPEWIRPVTYLNPMRYFVAIVRGIMMRGAGCAELMSEVYPMAVFAITVFAIAALRFRKRVS
ncbi:MAG: ABC transporter permease [candidate division Zixibacteria bacterium]|nr:ABC transporter permease [candidate division Zixibacteria bacterium]